MADDVSDIQAFYDKAIEEENGRLERHQIERDVTWRYLDKYLPASGTILEIGAATGAYTIPLAKKGYNITAVDLSPRIIAACKKRAAEEGLGKKVSCYIADGRELKGVPGKNFDAVLLMGPLYHLWLKEDREKTVRQAYDRLKKGGVIFSALVSRYGIWGNLMTTLPRVVDRQHDLRSIFKRGRDTVVPPGEFRGYFATVKEVRPLHEKTGFKTLVLGGFEPANSVSDEAYRNLQGEYKKLWCDLLFSISTEKSIIGASDHLLYIGVKEG